MSRTNEEKTKPFSAKSSVGASVNTEQGSDNPRTAKLQLAIIALIILMGKGIIILIVILLLLQLYKVLF